MPLWRAAGVWGRAGMVCLFVLLLCLFPNVSRARAGSRRSSENLAAALRASLCAALVTALLLPWNLSEFIAAGGFYAFFLDFIFFWIKASAVGCARDVCAARGGFCLSAARAAALRRADNLRRVLHFHRSKDFLAAFEQLKADGRNRRERLFFGGDCEPDAGHYLVQLGAPVWRQLYPVAPEFFVSDAQVEAFGGTPAALEDEPLVRC